MGGIAAIAAVVVALPTLMGGDEQPSGNGTVTGNEQSGDGNCIIAGGKNNSCPSPPAATSNSLGASPTWPTFSGCDAGTQIAVMPGGQTAESVRLNPSVDVREALTGKGAASYGDGHLYVALSAQDKATIQILSVRPMYFTSRPQADVAWVFDPQGGCGGDEIERVISLDLEHQRFNDLGTLAGEVPAKPEAGSRARVEPFGPTFLVKPGAPALIRIDAHACTGYHEWGLQIRYEVGGQIYTKELGSPSQPYRSVGGSSKPRPAFSFPMDRMKGLRSIEPIQEPFGCPAPGTASPTAKPVSGPGGTNPCKLVTRADVIGVLGGDYALTGSADPEVTGPFAERACEYSSATLGTVKITSNVDNKPGGTAWTTPLNIGVPGGPEFTTLGDAAYLAGDGSIAVRKGKAIVRVTFVGKVTDDPSRPKLIALATKAVAHMPAKVG
jgi:hypothetical protein